MTTEYTFLAEAVQDCSLRSTFASMDRHNRAVRWDELRQTLRRMRLATVPNKSAFALAAELNRKTIDRVEAISRNPSYKPDYETVAKWLTACGKTGRVTDFLKPFEEIADLGRKKTELDSSESATLPVPQEPQLVTGVSNEFVVVAPHDPPLSDPSRDDLAAADLLERLALALFRAETALRNRRAIQSTHEGQPRRRRTDAGVVR